MVDLTKSNILSHTVKWCTSHPISFWAIVILFLCYKRWHYRSRHLPPGPMGLPFVGYLLFMLKCKVHHKYVHLATVYGKIFSLRMGQKWKVILSDPWAIKEAFAKAEFSGKPSDEFSKLLGGYGIINTEGPIWKQQRKFVHSCLRSFGMSIFNTKHNTTLEKRIMGEVKHMLKVLKCRQGVAVDINHSLVIAVSNVICSLLMSVRFRFNDSRFRNLMAKIDEGFCLFGRIVFLNYFPFLRYFPMFLREFKKIERNKLETHQFFQNIIDEHKASFRENKKPVDVLDFYLMEIHHAEQAGRSDHLFQGKDHNSQMRQIIVDLFTAGMETTKTTLLWSFLYMLHNPDVAKAVQFELDEVVGRKRLPSYQDLPFLPITESTILEVLRKSSVVPLGNSHATTKEVYFRGYRIPENTEVVPFLYAINNDPDLWQNPDRFSPGRFLNEEGRVCRPEHFIPFGIGRRNCLGEILAKMQIFLFFSSFLHTFNLKLPEGHPLPDLEGFFGITLTPAAFQVYLEARPFEEVDVLCQELPQYTRSKQPST